MAGSGLAYQTEHKPVSSQAPADLSFLTDIWLNHSSSNERPNNGAFGGQLSSRPNGTSLPNSPAASTALLPQNTLSASDAILNAGQLRKEPSSRAGSVQSQSGDALLQAFSELPQQQSLKVNTAQMGAANGVRTSMDSQRAQSPFWLRPPSQGPVMSQVCSSSQHLLAALQILVSYRIDCTKSIGTWLAFLLLSTNDKLCCTFRHQIPLPAQLPRQQECFWDSNHTTVSMPLPTPLCSSTHSSSKVSRVTCLEQTCIAHSSTCARSWCVVAWQYS